MGLDRVLELFAIAKNYCSNDTHSHGMAARKVQPAQQEARFWATQITCRSEQTRQSTESTKHHIGFPQRITSAVMTAMQQQGVAAATQGCSSSSMLPEEMLIADDNREMAMTLIHVS